MTTAHAVAAISPETLSPTNVGRHREVIAEVTVSGTYAAGGGPLTAAAFGLQKILFFSADVAELSSTTALVPRYDYTNSMLKLYKANGTTNLTEFGAATADSTFRCRVVGI